jgi:HPt (histidine-containing phosphotransfer) domain-containing protein
MSKLLDYLLLPKAISDFEARYLARTNRIAFAFFALHVPVLTFVAWGNGTKPLLALVLSLATLAGPAIAQMTLRNPRTVSSVYGVTAMFFGGLLVHFGQGATQIEMHFYFFALLAMLAVFANPMVIIAATVTVALHHLVLWLLLPKSVFNYAAPVWVVGLHALFVVLESVAVCFIARTFFDNVIGLEKIVDARTKELAARGVEMRRVLDNVDQGFVVVAKDGTMATERSKAFERWFGKGHTRLVDALSTRSSEFAQNLSVAWEALSDDFLPAELLIEQLPKRMSFGEEHYDVAYLPVNDQGSFLVVVTNITARVTQETGDRERMETLSIFERVLADRSSVDEFFREANDVVKVMASGSPDLATFKRAVHTLKGNSAMFGLTSVAEACHDVESWVAEEEEMPSPRVLGPLLERWNRVGTSISRVVRIRSNTIELDAEEHAAPEREAKAISIDLWRRVHDLKLEPTKRRLTAVASNAKRIAERCGKEIVLKVEDNGLRTDANRLFVESRADGSRLLGAHAA